MNSKSELIAIGITNKKEKCLSDRSDTGGSSDYRKFTGGDWRVDVSYRCRASNQGRPERLNSGTQTLVEGAKRLFENNLIPTMRVPGTD